MILFNQQYSFSQSTPAIITDWMDFAGISDTLTVIPIAQDDSSNIISVGVTIDDSTSGPDILISKMDSTGYSIWKRTYSSPGINRDQAVAVTTDDKCSIYVAGVVYSTATNYDWVVLKYGYDGTLIWTYTLNGTINNYDVPATIKIKNSLVYVTGTVYDSVTQLNYATIQLNRTTGALNWKRQYNYHNLFDVAFAMDITQTGIVTIAGASQDSITKWNYCAVRYDSAGVAEDTTRTTGTGNSFDRPMAAKCDAHGNFYITGAGTDSAMSFNARTVKIDSSGNVSWMVDFGSTGYSDEGNDLLVDDSGYVYVCGKSFAGMLNLDYLLVKYNSSGIEQWHIKLDADSGNDVANKMCFDNYGNIILTGKAKRGSDDFRTVAYSKYGYLLWSVYFDGAFKGNDEATGITADAYGNIFVSGESQITDSTYEKVTIKYKTDYFLVPQDTVPAPSSLLFYPNWGQIIDTNDSLREDVFYYTINQFPKLYFQQDTINFVFAKVDSDTATTDTLERIAMNFLDGSMTDPFTFDNEIHDTDQVLNYFLGHCPDGITGVTGAERLAYSDVYRYTDVIFSNNNAGMKFQIIMNPGGEPQTVLHFTGHQSLQLVNNADLQVNGVLGSFIYQRPLVYQLDNEGNRISLGWLASYYISGDDVSFILPGSWDSREALVVECAREVNPLPTTQSIANLKWSVFYGGSEGDWCQAIANDDAGNLYSTGTTTSIDFPKTPGVIFGAYQGQYDAYVNKFKNLDELDWCTFFGGSNVEYGIGITVDANHDVYFVGRTFSTNFPINSTFTGGNVWGGDEGYIVKLAPDGQSFYYSNYIGSANLDRAFSVALLNNNVFIVGTSYPWFVGKAFPIMTSSSGGTYNQSTTTGTNTEGWIIKLDKNSGAQLWGTYFGSGMEDAIYDVKTIGSKVYISGLTTSVTNGNNPCGVPSNGGFPLCNPNGSYTQNNTGGYDAFIAEFDANDNLQWCTYVGGTGDEAGFPHIYPTYNGSTGYTVYLTGSSSSSNGPFTTSHGTSYNQSFQGGTISNTDAFIVKFVNRQIEWSTWFGGDGDDVIQGISGDVNYTYFFGGASSTSSSSNVCGVPVANEFPLCDYLSTYFYQDQYQNFSNSGCNFFFAAFRNSTDEIQWSTYFAERPIPGPPSYIMGLNYSPVTQQLYFGSYTANHYYMDYPIAIRSTGNPWAQNISAGKWDAIYGRFDIAGWVGIEENKQTKKIYNLYPSPADDYIGFMPLKNIAREFEMEIYNSLGQLIYRKKYDEKLENIRIRTTNYEQGLYLAHLKLKDGKVFDQKFIIQH